MSFTGVSTLLSTTSASLTVNPSSTANFFLVEVVSESATVWCDSIAGGNCTWAQVGTKLNGSLAASYIVTLFLGTPTGTGSSTATLHFTGTTPTIRCAGQQFSSGTGVWSLDGAQGNIDTTGTTSANYPTMSPSAAGELYFGYAWASGVITNGSTSGYTYQQDANGNGLLYNGNCTAASQTPSWGANANFLGIAVLMSSGAAAPPGPVQPGVTWLRRFRPRVQPAPAPPGPQVFPQVPVAQPGRAWLQHFRRVQEPVPPAPAVATASAQYAPASGAAFGADNSADAQAQVTASAAGAAATGAALGQDGGANVAAVTVSAAVAAGTAAAADAAVTAVNGAPAAGMAAPGPAWLRFFRHRQQPNPPPPVLANVSAAVASASGAALGQDNSAASAAAAPAPAAAQAAAAGVTPAAAVTANAALAAAAGTAQTAAAGISPAPVAAPATGAALGQDTAADASAIVTASAAAAAGTGTAQGITLGQLLPQAAAQPGVTWLRRFRHRQQPVLSLPAAFTSAQAGLASATGQANGQDSSAMTAAVSPAPAAAAGTAAASGPAPAVIFAAGMAAAAGAVQLGPVTIAILAGWAAAAGNVPDVAPFRTSATSAPAVTAPDTSAPAVTGTTRSAAAVTDPRDASAAVTARTTGSPAVSQAATSAAAVSGG